MTTTLQPPPQLVRDLAAALQRLKEARADGAPDHQPHLCNTVCIVCVREKHLNHLVERLPR